MPTDFTEGRDGECHLIDDNRLVGGAYPLEEDDALGKQWAIRSPARWRVAALRERWRYGISCY